MLPLKSAPLKVGAEGPPNFQVMRGWSQSEVYRKMMHYFARQLGAR
jgi:hypothetical protein